MVLKPPAIEAHGARMPPGVTNIVARPFSPSFYFHLYQITFNLKYELLNVNFISFIHVMKLSFTFLVQSKNI